MSGVRFSLMNVFAAVALLAIASAALVRPSLFWARLVWSLAIVVLVSSVLCCIYRQQTRPFWAGFATFGWGHMVLSLAPWFDHYTGRLLFTRQILINMGDLLGQDNRYISIIWSSPVGTTAFAFLIIGQSLLTLVVALLGGWIGRAIGRR